MEKLIILQGLTIEQFLLQIDTVIEKKIGEILKKKDRENKYTYLSRKEVAALFHITLPTLHEWTKLGRVKRYKIGNRVLYRSDELEESLRERKFKRD